MVKERPPVEALFIRQPGQTASAVARHQAFLLPPDENGCILSAASFTDDGYARFSVVNGRSIKQHIVAWALANRRWPPTGMEVMHRCNVRRCCNPEHLKLGTHAENRAHSAKSGLARNAPRLTPERAAALKADIRSGMTNAQLMVKHEITRPTVSLWRKRTQP